MLVAGEAGSGRAALLRALRAELEKQKPQPVVLAGGFQNGRYVPWTEDTPPESQVMSSIEQVVSLAEPIVPYAALVGQVLSKSKAAHQLRLVQPWMSDQQTRAIRHAVDALRTALDRAHDGAAIGAAKDLVRLHARSP